MDRRHFLQVGGVGAVGAAGVAALTLRGEAADAAVSGGSGVSRSFSDPIRLSSNENPLGICPAARAALSDAIQATNRYPGDYVRPFRTALARHLGVAEDQLVLGNGSTEVLQMVVQASPPGTTIVMADPTFEHPIRYAGPEGHDVQMVPLMEDHSLDLDRMRDIIRRAPGPSVAFLCNPNNPTGTITPSDDIEAWIRDSSDDTLMVVDEAYYEYVDHASYRTALPFVNQRENVLVVRTLSKIYGMAGLRVGYGVAHADLATRLRALQSGNNIGVLGAVTGVASIQDPDVIANSLGVNNEAKAIAQACLDELGLERLPTHANFVMHRINGDLETYRSRMAEQGILVGRPFPPMLDYNRVSFGTPGEMGRWAETLRDFRRKGWV